ncbi:uncharacterized protein V2V93DRAFT_321904 [Kockiozyma suomiensis]|uniref:uncharacterized protein n=1 Tax=Kockiozyma suomiensis TaxID=1337062 RepID=UPI003343DD33
MDNCLKRARAADSDDRFFDFAFSESPSAISTPELDYSPSKRFRSDFPTLDDAIEPVSSPEEASDLFNLFTPPLSASDSLESLDFPFDGPVIASDSVSAVAMFNSAEDDDGLTTDEETLPVQKNSKALFPPSPSAARSSSPSQVMPLGIEAVGPAIGQWTDRTLYAQPISPARQPSASPVLPKQHRLPSTHGPSPLSSLATVSSTSGSTTNVDALLEQYLDVNNVIDNSIALSNSKFWIDRYMTIPICGYLNRATAERALQDETPMPATTVSGISKPIKHSASKAQLLNNGKRRNISTLKRTASAPSVYGLKRRSFVTGKGREMVGLGVMVGDMLL